MQEDNKSLKTDSEMKEIMEIAVNDIKTAFIHIIHLIKKVKKNINIRKKQKCIKMAQIENLVIKHVILK